MVRWMKIARSRSKGNWFRTIFKLPLFHYVDKYLTSQLNGLTPQFNYGRWYKTFTPPSLARKVLTTQMDQSISNLILMANCALPWAYKPPSCPATINRCLSSAQTLTSLFNHSALIPQYVATTTSYTLMSSPLTTMVSRWQGRYRLKTGKHNHGYTPIFILVTSPWIKRNSGCPNH